MYGRDGVLAVATLAVVFTVGLLAAGIELFLRPVAVVTGIGGALAIEVVFLSYPDELLAVWDRSWVAVGATVSLVVVAVVVIRSVPWLLAAVCWGLVTYLIILGCIVLGIGNPVAVLVSNQH